MEQRPLSGSSNESRCCLTQPECCGQATIRLRYFGTQNLRTKTESGANRSPCHRLSLLRTPRSSWFPVTPASEADAASLWRTSAAEWFHEHSNRDAASILTGHTLPSLSTERAMSGQESGRGLTIRELPRSERPRERLVDRVRHEVRAAEHRTSATPGPARSMVATSTTSRRMGKC